MTDFGPEIVVDVLAAAEAGIGEIGQALSRTFDATIQVTVGAAGTHDPEELPVGWDGPGLVVMLAVGTSAALAVLPESSGLLPGWYANPDPTGKSKLTTLAQELGTLVLPEAFMPQDFQAAHVPHLGQALLRAGVAVGADLVPLELTAESAQQGSLCLLWPAQNPAQVFSADASDSNAPTAESSPVTQQAAIAPVAKPTVRPSVSARPTKQVQDLPTYSKSLLRIKVPVRVTLASKKQSISRIVELGPGSIIQFDKSCEEMLELEVGGHGVAEGEAVKVGDKFGIRLTSLILPDERFKPVPPIRR
jgi:flagellar motor switch/type III secretory pathway protein FliN